MRMLLFAVLLVVLSLALRAEDADHAPAEPAQPSAEPKSEKEKDLNDERFRDLLLGVAAQYKDYGLVDNEARWAPGLCREPFPGTVRLSTSKDDETHGRKLYYLYALHAPSYLELKEGTLDWNRVAAEKLPAYKDQKPTQILVKEAWVPKEAGAEDLKHPRKFGEPERFLEKDGKTYMPGDKGPLFVMVKLDAKTEGADAGWVYGTLTSDGKTVTSAGKAQSCMRCHENAGAGRLFGLHPRDEKK